MTLVDIFDPPLYPHIDIDADAAIANNNTVLDLSSGIDGTSNGEIISSEGYSQSSLAWSLTSDQTITLPNHSSLDAIVEGGITTALRLSELPSSIRQLLDWPQQGFSLHITPSGAIQAHVKRLTEIVTFEFPEKISVDDWHQIAIHIIDDTLWLGIDGEEASFAMPDNLDIVSAANAITISAVQTVDIASLKLFDWQGERSITFDSGELSRSVNADANGNASQVFQASPAVLAYTRQYADDRTLLAKSISFIVPSAYAQTAGGSCDSTGFGSPNTNDDPGIAAAERFMTMVIECFVKPKVDKAKIKYKSSKGFRKKTVALVEYKALEFSYRELERFKNNSIIVLNCLDAAVTGSNASKVGAVCDFITSFFLVGDLRDLLIQGWHYNFGNKDNYDPLTANLAALGAVFSFATVGTGAVGGAANAFIAVAKQVAKTVKKAGPAGQAMAKVLGAKLGQIANGSGSVRSKMQKLIDLAPVFEIAFAASLIYEEDPKVFQVLANMITSPHTLDNIIQWANRFSAELSAELGQVEQDRAPLQIAIAFFVNESNAAITKDAAAAFVEALREYIGDIEGFDGVDLNTDAGKALAAHKLNNVIDILLENADEVKQAIKAVYVEDDDLIRAFLAIEELGQGLAKKLANHRGYNHLELDGKVLDGVQLLRVFALVDKRMFSSYSQIWCTANQAASCSTLIPSLNFTPSMTSANRL